MKKFILTLFALVFSIILLPDNIANASSIAKYTVLLNNKNQASEFIDEVEKRSIKIIYEVEELGLYQIKGENEEVLDFLSTADNINSYNESVYHSPETSFFIKKNNSIVKDFSNNTSQNVLWTHQWDMIKTTNNGRSYQITEGSKNVVVGIIDSGIDANHPDLKDNIVKGSMNLVPKGGFNGLELTETGDINNINDISGHGTFVAGQVAANGKLKGVAPKIGIKSYRVLGSSKSESIWIIRAIIEAANDKVDVINISLGEYLIQGAIKNKDGSITNNMAEILAYKKAIDFAKKKGSIVVASAGNDSLNLNDNKAMTKYWYEYLSQGRRSFKGKLLSIPAALPGVVTVSSVGPSDNMSLFSNYGKGYIDIGAYGGDYRLLEQYGPDLWISENWFQKEIILGTAPNGGYTYSVGTSLAAPKVSAALALIIDDKRLKNPTQAILYLYKNGTIKGNKEHVGHGILNVHQLLRK
ncbi:S8 family peptidase [Pseudobacillus badius]|uniref:S8 family peptidase n=1 Tax=Bacillus badius TaxID=1455 RepID=UPI003D3487EC